MRALRFGKGIIENPDLNHVGLMYAGGIKPSNVVPAVISLLSYFPKERISIDAESGVRTGNDELDLNLVRDYLRGYMEAVS